MKVHAHKLASVTYRLDLGHEIEFTRMVEAETGNVLVVRALEEKGVYDVLELTSGRMAHISKGDVIAGALGSRAALGSAEVLGHGALLGVRGPGPDAVRRLREEHRVLVGGCPGDREVMRLLPPLTIRDEELDEGLAAIRRVSS